MSLERLTRADLWPILVALILGGAGLVVALRYYPIAFPEASIQFAVSRPQIEQRARDFLQRRGFDLSPFRQLVLFRYDDTAKTYLERELGLAEANRLMSSEINVWRWRVRFFRPPEKEELIVWLDPNGRLVGFEHIVEEAAAGARLEKTQALGVAEVFLYTQLGLNLNDYALVEDRRHERPNRLDYTFTWERKNFSAGQATYRISASVYGDQLGRALPFLKVPEQWSRDYARIRSRNTVLQSVAQLFCIPLVLAGLFVLFAQARRQSIPWKPLLWIGGVAGILLTISNINALPLASENFSTATPYWDFVTGWVVIYLGLGLLFALFLAMLLASGDALYRPAAPERVAIPKLFTLSGLRTKEFFVSTLIGYALAAFQLGFVVLFYLVARGLGAWSPAEVKYADFLSTALPWIYPLTMGVVATTIEESAFRLLAILFLKKYLKSNWLAVLIPAFIWGFLHSTYPQQPAWIRGVEVGLVGVVFGFVFLRFGILATLVSHYTYNAAMISLLLLRSHNLYFMLAGGLVMDAVLVPLAIAGALYWQHRRFASQPELFNFAQEAAAKRLEESSAPGLPATPTLHATPAVYVPLSRRRLTLAVAAGVAGLVLLLLLPVRPAFRFLRWQTSQARAEQIADSYLEQKNIDPKAWRRSSYFVSDVERNPLEYVRLLGGYDLVNQVWSTRLQDHIAGWRIRYFRPLEKEEYSVFVRPDGRVFRYLHLLDERQAGAHLTAAEAQRRGSDYLAAAHGVDVSGWKLSESRLEKRESRTDHRIVWEQSAPLAGEARVRAELQVKGDEPDNYHVHLKIPEEWLRQTNRPRIREPIAFGALIPFVVLLLVAGARRVPQHTFRWSLYLALAGLALAVTLAMELNKLRVFGQFYDTSVAWQTYMLGQFASSAFWAGFAAVAAFVLALAADLFYQARISPPVLLPQRNSRRSLYYRDAIVAGFGIALLVLATFKVYEYITQQFVLPSRPSTVYLAAGMDAYLPGVYSGFSASLYALLAVAALGIVIGFLKGVFRTMISRSIFVAVVLLIPAAILTIDFLDFVRFWIFNLAVAGLLAVVISKFLRCNLAAYLLASVVFFVSFDVLFYGRQPALWWNAPLAIATAIGVLALAILLLQRKGLESSATPPQ